MSNNEWAAQRRDGAEESRANNVIYIGRASFRMEPAPITADEIVGPIPPAQSPDHAVSSADMAHAAGEDVEPPYLRLRTLVDEGQVNDTEHPYTPELDLTEFAMIAENTGVEMIRRGPLPPLPRTLIADVASFPHAMPTGIEPATELLLSRSGRISFSRTRLIGWGALAFCAGLVASAGAHMLATPAHLGATANAASVTAADHAAAPVAPPTVAAPTVVSPAPVAAEPAAAPATPKIAAPESARADSPQLAYGTDTTTTAPVRTRSGATAQARAQTRARGKMRSLPRGGSTASETATEAAEPPSEAAPSAAPAPAARPAAHTAANWVDPFAE